MNKLKQITCILPERIRRVIESEFSSGCIEFDRLTEIRIRVERPLMLMFNPGGERIYEQLRITPDDIAYMIQMITRYSMYAYQDNIRQGYVTISGGHRVGLIGQTMADKGRICGQKYISFMNIRVAHEVIGCADKLMDFICDGSFKNTLLISPPGCGKTTLLRDIVRHISYGKKCRPMKVALVDERSEIAACHVGIPQNDIGPRTDVMDMGLKAEGMLMLVRSMSPEVIAVDELGGREDMEAVRQIICCGCKVLASVHGYSIKDCYKRPELISLLGADGFERAVVISDRFGAGTIEEERKLE